MSESSPKKIEVPVTWETLKEKAGEGNVVSTGSKEGGPYVVVCESRSPGACRECVLEYSCPASLGRKLL